MHHLEPLETAEQVFEALGGNKGLETLTGSKPNTVSMWKKAGGFPANSYIMIMDALRAVGKTAPASLWSMKQKVAPSKRRRAA